MISEQIVEKLVRAALQAPTGDNCQPWFFEWHPHTSSLHIRHKDSRGRHFFNRSNGASCLSLGAVLESIDLAASLENLKIHYQLSSDLRHSPGAEVQIEATSRSKDLLAEALFLRASDRRPYRGGKLGKEFLAQMAEDQAKISKASLYFQETFSKELLDYLMDMDCLVWESQNAHHDLFEWIRFEREEIERTRDGMPWRTLGATYFQSRILKLCRNFSFQKFMNRLAFLKQMRAQSFGLIKSSAALGLFTVRSMGLEDLVEAGRLWLRAWCRLNQQGWGVQPVTISALLVYYEENNLLTDVSAYYRERLRAGKMILQKAFGFSDKEIPVMQIRTGISSPLGKELHSLRLPLSEVFTISQ